MRGPLSHYQHTGWPSSVVCKTVPLKASHAPRVFEVSGSTEHFGNENMILHWLSDKRK